MPRRKRLGCTALEVQIYEVEWYREHGRHQDRIKLDHLGREYVVGDVLWNRTNQYRKEWVQHKLSEYVAQRVTGIKK